MEEEKEVFGVSEGRPALSERMSEELFNAVHQAVGNASMCWDNTDGAGTFDAKRAGDISFELCYLIADEIEAERDAACGYIESTITRRDQYEDTGRQHIQRARVHMSACPRSYERDITIRVAAILGTAFDMYISVYHALDYAEDLISNKTPASKHALETELKTLQGFMDIAKEQLKNEDLKEDVKHGITE